MVGRRMLQLVAIALVLGCVGEKSPTGIGPSAPRSPSEVISDGAHGGNKDFFFLPPMVPLPLNNPDFEIGKFNNTLAPSLKIVICELNPNPVAPGLPTAATTCNPNVPLVKTFAPGTVNVVNLPLRQNGWWTLFNLPPDGFYYVLWDTRQSNLNVNKYYRIQVLVGDIPTPLGVADVDPMSSLSQWKYANTGQVIQLIDDVLLPIPFRVEKGGGSTLCGGATICASASIATQSTTPQVVQTQGNNGPIAGLVVPPNWLPPGSPANVVVTIRAFDTGHNDVASGTQEHPCHTGLVLEQFNGCFTFTTTPALPQSEAAGGHQFLNPVTVVACFVLHDTDDPRYKYSQLWSSGPNEPPHPLVSVSDALVLTAPTEHNCGSNFTEVVIGSNASWSSKLAQVASASWRRVTGGVGRVFGVKTAYAVDLGLGGLSLDFSNVGPVLTAQIQRYTATGLTLGPGATTTSTARIVGTTVHNAGALATGIGGIPVTFSVAPGNGTLQLLGSELPGAAQVQSITNTNPIDAQSPTSGGGFAPVNWTMPTVPGTYTLTATGPALGGPVTFTATVPAYQAWQGAAAGLASSVVAFGGAPFCSYLAQFTNMSASLNLDTAGSGTAGVTGTYVESLANPPCGNILPLPPHNDIYTSTSVTRTGNTVTATLAPVGNPISASVQFSGTMSADQQTVTGTLTFHRTDQGPPLDWTFVVPVTLTVTPVIQ